ncbi:MAG: LysR substrate-binding domain-containing protein, partial [Pseudomonadota bacterium]
RMQTNNIFALKEAVLMGLGAAVMPHWFVAKNLTSGDLINLLPNWHAPALDINVAYLPNRYQTKRLRAFLQSLEKAIPEIEGIEAL